ncbi:hypothetical protein [Actinomadura hibisca]|uniref:hypothetical protein n=1 Tax=Actinomadura hibisca TaxID=68565 RepID=UPI00082ABAC4|nr:hypothetical protein [Actinomadura hibisca]
MHATFHLTHPNLHGPAERTLVQPWIGELTGLALNAYTDEPHPAPGALTGVDTMSVPLAVTGSRVALAA